MSAAAIGPAAYDALDRLNGYVRSEAHRDAYLSSPRRAIYEMKRQAIIVATAADLAMHKKVQIAVTCRDCGGSGRYVDSYGYEFAHCRACTSKGTVVLHFIDTRIALPDRELRWHTPEQNFRSTSVYWNVGKEEPAHLHYLAPSEVALDWTVNQPGRDLAPWEVARDLVLAEQHFKSTRYAYRSWGFSEYGCSLDPFRYDLYVGRTERVCWRCSAAVPETRGWLGKTIDRVHFTAAICEDCQTLLGSPWPTAIPASLVENEHIREWMRLHPTIAPSHALDEGRI